MIDWEQARRDKEELDALRLQELAEIETEWDKVRYLLENPCADIYFIMASYPGGASFIKIGVATDVKTRLGDLQVGNPVKLVVLGTIKDIPRSRIHSEENRLHKQFADLRAEGEWFRASGRLLDFVRANTTKPKWAERLAARETSRSSANWRTLKSRRIASLHGPVPQFMTRAMFEHRHTARESWEAEAA